MKQPEIKQCPCCEVALRTEDYTDMGTVEPICKQAHANDNVLIDHILVWRCRVCGCEWRHGQFRGEAAQ